MRPGSSACGFFPIRISTKRRQKKWDAERFYTDPKYYNDKNLVRPYRVGMSCGFCHVGPSPVKPPADPENPKWENLNSNPGAQYFWVDRILFWEKDESSFIYQLIHTSLPGTLDTSFISTDYINNPRTMNAVYSVAARLKAAERWGEEKLGGGGLKNKQFQDYQANGGFGAVLQSAGYGLDAASAERRRRLRRRARRAQPSVHQYRTYSARNGCCTSMPSWAAKKSRRSKSRTPRKIRATGMRRLAQTADVALFFLKTAKPDLLKDAPGGE